MRGMNAKVHEKLIRLADACKLPWLPRPIHPATIYRWVQVGRRGQRLQAVRSVGGLCVTESGLRDYFDRLAGPAVVAAPVVRRPTLRRRDRSFSDADAALDAAGI